MINNVIKTKNKSLLFFSVRNLLFILCLILIISCNKKNISEITGPGDEDTTTVKGTYENGIFIINEGNFNWGNASISFIDGKDDVVHNDIYLKVNNTPLGDVAEDMKVFNGRGYIVVNNSNAVEVVSLKDFKSIKTIIGFNSPRNIEIIDSTKAYVTNMIRDIAVIDLTTLTITKTIQFPDWTESMIRYNDYLFVTSIGNYALPNSKRKAKIRILRTSDDQVIDSIITGKEPLSIVLDRKQKIWVLCSGGFENYEAPSLLRIDPELKIVEKTFTFNKDVDHPSRLVVNPSGDTLYYLNNGVFKMPVGASDLPSQPLIPADGRLFYGLGVNPNNGTLLVSDAVDYQQNGWVYQYNQNSGVLIKSFQAGRIPGSFCFSGISKQVK
jgi:DNA-binding beta-propeller fold protein YncE